MNFSPNSATNPRDTGNAVPRTAYRAVYWLFTAALFALAANLLWSYVPVDGEQGAIQKVFYVHLPAAINTFLACLVVFIASVGYLTQRRDAWDRLAGIAAKVAVGFCTVVLGTGMYWGHVAWGHWWTWSPRLTFSLVLWLLYVVYLLVRSTIEAPRTRATVAAVYGVVAFLDVPLVYLSARMLPDIHPSSITLVLPMKLTLLAWFIPVTLLNAGLIYTAFKATAGKGPTTAERKIRNPLPPSPSSDDGYGVAQRKIRNPLPPSPTTDDYGIAPVH